MLVMAAPFDFNVLYINIGGFRKCFLALILDLNTCAANLKAFFVPNKYYQAIFKVV